MKRKYYKGNIMSWDHWMDLRSDGYTDVIGDVDFSDQNLTSLEGSPITCHNFWCDHNQLTSLKGAPIKTHDFYCYDNKLTSLEGAPEKTHNFYCNHNQLTSLEGAPRKTHDFYCYENQLTSLEHHPEEFTLIDARNNPINKSDPIILMLILQEKAIKI